LIWKAESGDNLSNLIDYAHHLIRAGLINCATDKSDGLRDAVREFEKRLSCRAAKATVCSRLTTVWHPQPGGSVDFARAILNLITSFCSSGAATNKARSSRSGCINVMLSKARSANWLALTAYAEAVTEASLKRNCQIFFRTACNVKRSWWRSELTLKSISYFSKTSLERIQGVCGLLRLNLNFFSWPIPGASFITPA
jgi:hypothetical protein